MKLKTLGIVLLFTALMMSFTKLEDWYLLESSSYTILFPKKPTASTQKVDSKVGQLTMNLNIYEIPENEKDDNYVYLLNETSYPDSVINSDMKDKLNEFYEKAIEGSVNSVKGKLLTEKTIQVGEYPGREVLIDYPAGGAIVKLRLVLVKNIVYLIEVMTDAKKVANESSEKFFNSFQLKK